MIGLRLRMDIFVWNKKKNEIYEISRFINYWSWTDSRCIVFDSKKEEKEKTS